MQRLVDLFARLAQRYLPDPMVPACLLTLFVLMVALLFPQTSALAGEPLAGRSVLIVQMWLAIPVLAVALLMF